MRSHKQRRGFYGGMSGGVLVQVPDHLALAARQLI